VLYYHGEIGRRSGLKIRGSERTVGGDSTSRRRSITTVPAIA